MFNIGWEGKPSIYISINDKAFIYWWEDGPNYTFKKAGYKTAYIALTTVIEKAN